MTTVEAFNAPDATQIAPRLWVGAAPDNVDRRVSRHHVDYLAVHANIGLVIDCRLGADDRDLWAHRRDARYVPIGVEDSGAPLPPEFFTAGVELIFEHWASAQSSVLVHCESGAHRSPALALAVLLVDGQDADAAIHRIIAARPVVGARYFADASGWFRWFSGPPSEPACNT